MKDETEKWKAEIRGDFSNKIAAAWAMDWGSGQLFQESQQWQGYKQAFQSWADAIWRWADSELTPDIESVWRKKLLAQRSSFSPMTDYSKPATERDIERYLQIYLLRRADFLDGLRHKKETDPNWFKEFGFYFYVASLLDDDDLFKELARLTQRKTSQTTKKGGRLLRYWLLRLWIPGCFWAATNDGIKNLLARRDEELDYSKGRIKNVISELKLWRPAKPLYRIEKNGIWFPRS